jgi:hypothetical protein
VQKLLAKNRPVRALVRNKSKAQQVLGTSSELEYPPLQVIEADMGRSEDYEQVLDQAVEGCDSIISVMGATRFSKLTDFLPWRLFGGPDVSSWADRDHPYYSNYLGQKKLIDLAEKHKVKRFVRLTGLSIGFSAFNPFGVLFNLLLSFTSRYGILCEQALANSKVPYVVLRPGGLAEDERDTSVTNIQIEPSGKLPVPSRIGRSDVAELAIAACSLPQDKSYILACRWCGEAKPKPQGVKEDGYATAQECMEKLEESKAVSPSPPAMKHYAIPVSIAVYSLLAVAVKMGLALWHLVVKIVRG